MEILSTLLLIGMGSYGTVLYFSNKLGLYIHPRFFEESLAASILSLVIGFVSFWYIIREKNRFKIPLKNKLYTKIFLTLLLVALSFINSLFLIIAAFIIIAPDKNLNKLLAKNDLLNILAIVIVLAGLVLPPRGLSSVTASQRSIDLNSINLTQNTISAIQNFNKSTTNYSLGDWIAMSGYNPDPYYYKDKEVKVSGFIYKPDNLNLKENQALIARFIITCCAVDARPVGLRFILDNNEFEIDDWVEIQGVFDVTETEDLIIKTNSITKVDIPSNPYIY